LEGEALRGKVAAAAAAISRAFDLLDERNPFGSLEFQLEWAATVDSNPDDLNNPTYGHHSLPGAIERCIQSCLRKGITIPKPFYSEKRKAEFWSECRAANQQRK